MKRVLFALALVVTLFFTPAVLAQPDDDPQGVPQGTLLSELVTGWLGWIFDALAPETTPAPETGAAPPPPPPAQPTDGPNGGPVVLPGG